MDSKPLVWIGMFVGSTVGGFIPSIWGAGLISFSSIILTGVGGIIGIILGFKMSQ